MKLAVPISLWPLATFGLLTTLTYATCRPLQVFHFWSLAKEMLFPMMKKVEFACPGAGEKKLKQRVISRRLFILCLLGCHSQHRRSPRPSSWEWGKEKFAKGEVRENERPRTRHRTWSRLHKVAFPGPPGNHPQNHQSRKGDDPARHAGKEEADTASTKGI